MSDPWPSKNHRTMAEVITTRWLQNIARTAPYSMSPSDWRWLRELEARAVEPEGMGEAF
jgi:hypothetical protein